MSRDSTEKLVEPATLAPVLPLIIVDYDSRRYSVERFVRDLTPWDKEVSRIRRAGRDVWLIPTELHGSESLTKLLCGAGFAEWPSKSIVDPAIETEASRNDRDSALAQPRESPGRSRQTWRRRAAGFRRKARMWSMLDAAGAEMK